MYNFSKIVKAVWQSMLGIERSVHVPLYPCQWMTKKQSYALEEGSSISNLIFTNLSTFSVNFWNIFLECGFIFVPALNNDLFDGITKVYHINFYKLYITLSGVYLKKWYTLQVSVISKACHEELLQLWNDAL